MLPAIRPIGGREKPWPTSSGIGEGRLLAQRMGLGLTDAEMTTFKALRKLAEAAYFIGIDRADFLAVIDPVRRSNAAEHYDWVTRLSRSGRLLPEDIDAEARRIAVEQRIAAWCAEFPQFGTELLVRMFTGRLLSDGMRRQAEEAHAYGERVTEEEIASYREEATNHLTRSQSSSGKLQDRAKMIPPIGELKRLSL